MYFIKTSDNDTNGTTYDEILDDILMNTGACYASDDLSIVKNDLYIVFRSREMKENNAQPFCYENSWYCN